MTSVSFVCFFFKQKTAYEMRISDWSSDVCSSDLDQPDAAVRSEPPMPRPPVEARPRSLYVTDIQTWVRDPYAIYAKRILRLRRLDPVDAPPDARLRGNIIHDVLARFLKRHPDALQAADAASNGRESWREQWCKYE